MSKVAMVAALQREVSGLIRGFACIEHEYEGRRFTFFECDELVVVCAGIGLDAARRAAEAVIGLYRPTMVLSVGFAGALQAGLPVGEVVVPAVVIDARDGSRSEIAGGSGALVTFIGVAGRQQKENLAQSYGAQLVDMEAAAVAASARAHEIRFGAIKAISDDSSFEMPEMSRFVDVNGRFMTANFAFSVALRPWLWARTAILARNSRKAARLLADHLQRFRKPSRKAPASRVSSSEMRETAEVTANGFHAGGRE